MNSLQISFSLPNFFNAKPYTKLILAFNSCVTNFFLYYKRCFLSFLGQGARETAAKSSGVTVANFNDYYFLTDPDEFIYTCFPFDSKWQLLAKPYTKQQFTDIANCEQAYFENHIQITTKLECLYKSENGVCDIGIKKANEEEFKHLYKLYFNHELSKTKLSKELQLDRYVAVMNNKSAVNFRIRFPGEGIYKMEIYGGSPTGFPLICSFRLDCNEGVSNVKPFPCNPESGFGPNLVTVAAGLEAESHKTGFINVKKNKNVNIRFNINKNVQVQTVLVHNNIQEEVLSRHVNHKVKGQHLEVNVEVPQQGEYALQINTKTKGSSEPFKNACNYLLASEDMNKKKRFYEVSYMFKQFCYPWFHFINLNKNLLNSMWKIWIKFKQQRKSTEYSTSINIHVIM